jgi:two-component system nitrogen regulation sensor histidine kinase GlnL
MALPGSGLIRLSRRAPAPSFAAPGPLELIAALPVPVLVVDGEGVVMELNAAAELLINLGRPVILGMKIEVVIGHPLTSMPNDAPFAAYDTTVELPDGRDQIADLMVAPLPDRAGWRVVSVHSRARAHSAGRRAEREGGARAAVGAAAMLAHEIKNPLSGIRGAAQLLDSSADEASRELTGLIRNEVDRIAALIDRMEGFTDTRPIELSPQNIHAILHHAREIALQGFARHLPIREVYDPSLPAVLGNRDALIQVVLNLLKNAAEAMGDAADGAITLTTAYRHGVSVVKQGREGRLSLPIEICVIDDGPGPPAEIADHLFDPFVSSKKSGRGLGLALVDKLIADQGGMVEYGREGRPPKTVFRLLLPRAGGR